MNKIKKIIFATAFFVMAFSWSSFSQYAVGDYITICNGVGPWNWAGNTAGNETWAIVDTVTPLHYNAVVGNPSNTKNVFIRTGHTVNVNPTGPYQCLNLTVESGGKLWTQNSAVDIYLELYGTFLLCDGQIGDGSTFDGVCLTFESANISVTGSGTIDVSRIRKNRTVAPVGAATTTNLTISKNINLRYAGSGVAIYNNSATSTIPTIFNVTVSAGDTLNLVSGGAGIDSAYYLSASGAWQHGGTFTIDGVMIVPGRLYLTTNNAAAANKCKWQVNSGGYLKVDRIVAPASGAAKDSLVVNAGGTLEISGDSAWVSISSTNNVYSFASGSTVIYSSSSPTGNQVVRGSTAATDLGLTNTYGNLILSGAGTKTGGTAVKLKNDLTISSPVKFAPGAATINQIGGNWINYNDSGYTEGTATWQFNGSAAQTITTPGGETFYTIDYRNTTASKLTLNSPVDVTNQLVFGANGKVDLNSNTLTVKTAATTGISNGGNALRYIISEKTDNSSKIKWKIGTTASANLVYIFPFGTNGGSYIPDTLKVISSGTVMGDVTLSTYGTSYDNTPYPTTPDLVLNIDQKFQPSGTNDSAATVDRFWQVDVTGDALTGDTFAIADLSLTYAAAELPSFPYNVQTELMGQWYLPDSNSWQWPTVGTPYGSTVRISGNNHYGPWTLVNSNSPLPIKLLNFNAKLRDDVVDVTWSTASEVNNDYFTVEKSRDGKNFDATGKVRGAGSSTETHYYGFTDPHPYTGLSYYRLRQTDYDGHFSFSDVVPVLNKDKNSGWYIFPNPATDVIHIGNTGTDYIQGTTLQLFNPEGALIKSIAINAKNQSVISVDIKDLSNGIYIGKITDDFHQEIFKIVKN